MRTIEENKKLIKEMPFLLPHNRWTGEINEDYDYSYTELDVAEIPRGWDQMFLDYCREITPVLKKADYLNKFRFIQVKEKWGFFHCYTNGIPKLIWDEMQSIESKYVDISKNTCVACGKPGKMTYTGWICPWCRECWETDEWNSKTPYDKAIKEWEEE